MSALPEKPAAVAHVSDAHWEAALDIAVSRAGSDNTFAKLEERGLVNAKGRSGAADYARCLILLGEVPEPMDPIEAAIEAVWSDGFKVVGKDAFKERCLAYFAGLTFPVQP